MTMFQVTTSVQIFKIDNILFFRNNHMQLAGGFFSLLWVFGIHSENPKSETLFKLELRN